MLDGYVMVLALICAGIAWWIDRKPYREYKRFCNDNRCPDCIYHNWIFDGAIFRGNRCMHPYMRKK